MMKSLKTYNMDQDVIQILARQANKSQYVCRAVRKFSSNKEEFDLRDLESRQIAAAIFARESTPDYVKAILYEWMQN